MILLRCIYILLAVAVCSPSAGQGLVSIGFYNVENLYDTIPSNLYDDGSYTPKGTFHWNTERYYNKITNVARVLDDMSLDLAGLAEIENEEVLKDLVRTMKSDYNYIYIPCAVPYGRDIALLYKGLKFIPEETRLVYSGTSREFLYVRGHLCGERIDLIVCHLPSMLNTDNYRERAMRTLHSFAESLHDRDTGSRIVLMGDFNASPSDRIMKRFFETPQYGGSAPFFYPFEQLARHGIGSYVYDNRWLMYDNIFLSSRFLNGSPQFHSCGIHIRDYLMTDDNSRRRGYPLRTFSGRRYTNGFSDHLPVYVQLAISEK